MKEYQALNAAVCLILLSFFILVGIAQEPSPIPEPPKPATIEDVATLNDRQRAEIADLVRRIGDNKPLLQKLGYYLDCYKDELPSGLED